MRPVRVLLFFWKRLAPDDEVGERAVVDSLVDLPVVLDRALAIGEEEVVAASGRARRVGSGRCLLAGKRIRPFGEVLQLDGLIERLGRAAKPELERTSFLEAHFERAGADADDDARRMLFDHDLLDAFCRR